MSKTLEEILSEGSAVLEKNQIENAGLDAWYLMEHVFDISRSGYFLNKTQEADNKLYQDYISLIEKRASHVPLQYLTGVQEFMGLPFYVNNNVLIPRQDTEILVEEALKYAKNKRVLDMCTGSGCIICSLAKLTDLEKAIGVDVSVKAIEVAEQNVENLNVKVELIHSDLFAKIKGSYHLIVSNPPYIESREIETLMPEVRLHEPILALDGCEDGLYFYRKITQNAADYLTEDGVILFEIGYNQGIAVKELLEKQGFHQVRIIKDLSGLDRVVCGFK
jgi:protein-(glutamine-N5) methyltransferase, release factor-specific